jgi:hypothetical protein
MPGVRSNAETQVGRSLRVLLIWIGSVPTNSSRSRRWRFGKQLQSMLEGKSSGTPQNDWARRPIAALIWWYVPTTVGVSTSLLVSSSRVVAAVWVVAFAWMGIGCVLNARRCHRLHCYFSGPILLLGAVAVGLLASGVMSLGSHAINNTISITLVLALISFLPEAIWGRYRRS